jgi:hypothetical protein
VLLAAPSVKPPKPWRAASGGNLARLRPGDRLAPDAPALAPTWVELGTTSDGGALYIDLAATGGLDLDASGEAFTCLARALTATLCAAPHGGALRLHVYGFDAHGVDPFDRIEHHDTIDDLARAVAQRDVDDTTIVITTARIDTLDDEDVIVVAPADDGPSTRWRLRIDERDSQAWTVEPLGLAVSPSGLAADELAELAAYYEHAATDIICDPDDDTTANSADPRAGSDDAPHWAVMVRLLGPVEVTNPAGAVATLRRKPLEALVWLVEHRAHASRTSLENGLWTAEVSPDTLQNAISEARRALRSLATPPEGEEWLPRTMRLHPAIVSDAELVSAAIKQAAGQDDLTAARTLEGAVALLRGAPLSDVSYVWADAESVPSRLTLLGVRAAAELAMRYLALGDSDGALHATAIGLTVLPGHEQLVCLRMQAHAARHDLVSLRGEYETYERTVVADDFADGEVSPEVAATYRRLVEHARMRPAS